MRINASKSITTGKLFVADLFCSLPPPPPSSSLLHETKNNAECAGSKAEYLSAATNKSAAFQAPCLNVGVNKARLLDGIE